jgi:predicted nucleic acid-binding protein
MREIEAGGARDSAMRTIRGSARLAIVSDVNIPAAVTAWRLDPGESQVLAAALLQPGSGVVIDDRAARKRASLLSIPLIGTVGTIALARRRGIIDAAAPIYQSLRTAGLFLSPALIKAILEELGEER